MNKILKFKKIVSIGFLAAFLAVSLSAGTAQASFRDWFNVGGDSQQAKVGTRTKKAKTYNLKVNISGWGTITSDDGKINCGKGNDRANSDCSENYAGPTTVTLTAPAYTVYSSDKNYVSYGYTFSNWTGVCRGRGNNPICVVSLKKPNRTVSVAAVFKKDKIERSIPERGPRETGEVSIPERPPLSAKRVLKVEIIGDGQIIGPGINCVKSSVARYGAPAICEAKIDEGKFVILTAKTVTTAYKFSKWSDNCQLPVQILGQAIRDPLRDPTRQIPGQPDKNSIRPLPGDSARRDPNRPLPVALAPVLKANSCKVAMDGDKTVSASFLPLED